MKSDKPIPPPKEISSWIISVGVFGFVSILFLLLLLIENIYEPVMRGPQANIILPLFLINGLLAAVLSAFLTKFSLDRKKLNELTLQQTHEQEILQQRLNQTKEELRKVQAKLAQNEKTLSFGSLSAGIAHEINNPVNFAAASIKPLERNIVTLHSILKKYKSLMPQEEKIHEENNVDELMTETQSIIDGMREGLRRTTSIVKDLSAFSRLHEPVHKVANIHKILDSVLNEINHILHPRIKVVKKYGNIPSLECYPTKMAAVFKSLITNASEAIKETGEIHIRTSQEGDHLVISIKDNGVGISKENLERIFEPFFSTKEIGRGTGLGLSADYGIIKEHKGHIEVKSELGQGSEFIVFLPILIFSPFRKRKFNR